jgi:hypothetical protein
VADQPWERESIVEFVRDGADGTPAGAQVLDVGAGDAPYRELFAHADDHATDWEECRMRTRLPSITWPQPTHCRWETTSSTSCCARRWST